MIRNKGRIRTTVYKSRTEEQWAAVGSAVMQSEIGEQIIKWFYEPVSLKLPGGSYTPDFMYLTESGSVIFVEIKGSKHQRGYRDARSKLRAAAEIYDLWLFYEVRPAWVLEKISE